MSKSSDYVSKMQKIIDSDIRDDSKEVCLSLVSHLGFMLDVLSDLKDNVSKNGVVIDFKQGKQEMKITNPALKDYTKMIKAYDNTASILLKVMDKTKKNKSSDLDAELDTLLKEDY